MSILTKIRKVFHTTPLLREVSQGWASTFGMSSSYAAFDAEIGYGQPPPPGQGAAAAVLLSSYQSGGDDDDVDDYDEEDY